MRLYVNPHTSSASIPAWMKAERYLYCDNFAIDFVKPEENSILSFVKRLLLK